MIEMNECMNAMSKLTNEMNAMSKLTNEMTTDGLTFHLESRPVSLLFLFLIKLSFSPKFNFSFFEIFKF